MDKNRENEIKIEQVEGHIQEREARKLYYLAQQAKCGIIEIGAYRGKSTIALALGSMTGNNVPVWSIDLFEPFDDPPLHVTKEDKAIYFRNLIATGTHGIVNVLNAPSFQIAGMFYAFKNDMLFIDGNHGNAYDDFQYYFKYIVLGGLIIFHDIDRMDVSSALAKIEEMQSIEQVEIIGNMGIYKKI